MRMATLLTLDASSKEMMCDGKSRAVNADVNNWLSRQQQMFD